MPKLFLFDDPPVRFHAGLAEEIGSTPSVLLLQIEFWIATNGHLRDGRFWTYQSLKSMHRVFPCWTRETVRRALIRLYEMDLILIKAHYNKIKWDKTRWYTLNEDGCAMLDSVRLLRVRKEDPETKKETTLPDIYIKHNGTSQAEVGPDIRDDWDDLEGMDALELLPTNPKVPPLFNFSKIKREKPENDGPTITSTQTFIMQKICYGVESVSDQTLLNSTQRGRAASALGKLRDAGADLNRLPDFYEWWGENWRSKNKFTGQYQMPRPEQVTEFWLEAMRKVRQQESQNNHAPVPSDNVVDIEEAMQKRAEGRK